MAEPRNGVLSRRWLTAFERCNFLAQDSSAGVLRAFAQSDQSQEQLACGVLTSLVQTREHVLRAAAPRAPYPPAGLIGGPGQPAAFTFLEKFSEGELQEGQH